MENLLTVNQTAAILKVHPLTVRRYLRQKNLLAVKISGAVRISEDQLKNFQKDYSVKPKVTQNSYKTHPKTFNFQDPLWQLSAMSDNSSLGSHDK